MKYQKKYKPALWKQQLDASLSTSVPSTPSQRIASVSRRRLPLNKRYREAARAFKAEHPWCQCCRLIFDRKPMPTTEVHHCRGRVGSLLLDTRFWKAACTECHDYIHANPSTAQKLGLFCPMGKWNTPPRPGYCDRCSTSIERHLLLCPECSLKP